MHKYYQNKVYLERKISEQEQRLAVAKQTNENRQKLLAEKNEAVEVFDAITQYLEKLKVLEGRIIKENKEFRTRRLNFLNAKISEDLSRVFTKEQYQVSVECDFNRKNRVSLTLTDVHGNVFYPRISNGMLVQYLTSFSAANCVTQALGSHNLFVDEAFGASSMDNLPTIGQYLGDLVDEGMQIILVSQNPAIYQDLPRHEINLWLDTTSNSIRLHEIDYFRKDETNE